MFNLSAVWWFVLAGLGVAFPYWTLYLRENAGLTGTQVGLVAATLPFFGLIAQPLWGFVADRTGQRVRVLTGLCIGAAAGYVVLGFADGIVMLMLASASLALFSTAVIPNAVAVSLAALNDDSATAFGRVRVLGTLGFAASVGLFPYVLRFVQARFPVAPGRETGGEPHLELLFFVAAGLLLCAGLFASRIERDGNVSIRASRKDWRLLVDNGPFVRVLVFTFLSYLFIQGPMVLFPILVRAQGGGIEAISEMWLLMLALEVPLVFYFGASVARVGARGVIAIGIGAAALRWGVSGFVEDLRWVYAAQLLHGVTVWGIILGVPLYVDRAIPERLRATGQGLLAMIGVSLGSILSNVGAGWLTEAVGPKAPAQVASIAALLLTFALPFALPAVRTRPADAEPAD